MTILELLNKRVTGNTFDENVIGLFYLVPILGIIIFSLLIGIHYFL